MTPNPEPNRPALAAEPRTTVDHVNAVNTQRTIICPFMSRPVAFEGNPEAYQPPTVFIHKVECLRDKCAAWGPVPEATTRDGQEVIKPHDGGWEVISRRPLPGPGGPLGCRRIGGEVPE